MVEISPQSVSSHQPSKPPSDAKLRALIGPAWSRYQTALKGLTGMDLIPEYYQYGPSGGWTLRFEVDHMTGCALHLSKSLVGLVAIGPRSEAMLAAGTRGDEQLLRLVKAAPQRGKTRWVQVALRSDEDVRRFLSLAEAKLRAREEEAGAAENVSHTPHRRTTVAAPSRKRSDTPPRRSAGRRSSRG